MEVLRQHNPRLAEELGKAGNELPSEEIKTETAASGVPTMVIKGIHIHSPHDPEREAARLVEAAAAAIGADDEEPALVLGFGLGYAATALAAKFPERPLIIAEKHSGILKRALEIRDFRTLLSRDRLVFVLGGSGEGISGALSLFESSPGKLPLIIQNRALSAMDGEWYAAVEERIRTWNSRANVNRATQKRFGKRWVQNLSKNLEAVRDFPGISGLKGILHNADIPAFLAAAGPSLDATGPLLGEIYKRCIIIAVDTSLRFLLNRGINADFVVSVDPQYWNFRHLDRCAAPKTRLIAESAVYPACMRNAFGGIFLCGSLFPLGRFIENRVDPKGDLGTGGSVATSAWDFVRLLGAGKVWIAGLDLSFPENRTHFKGAVFEEKSHAESFRFAPAETWNFRALRDGQPFLAKRRGGGAILTDKRLSLYAAWFENRFSQFPEIKNISLGAEGLELKGLEPGAEAEILALPERRDEIDRLLAEAYAVIEKDFAKTEKTRAESYKNASKTLCGGLEELKNLAEDAAQSVGNAAIRGKMGHLSEQEREKALKKLDNADASIKKSAVKEIAGFLFPETENWEAEIAAKTGDPLMRHLEFSARFYRAISESAAYNLLKLKKQ